MQPITDFLPKFLTTPTEKQKVISPRAEILNKFIKILNEDRMVSGREPYPPSYICMRMYRAGYKTVGQLNMFYGSISDSTNFSAMWHIKTKK